VAAQVGADAGHREPGRGQDPAVAGPAAGPGRQRAEEQRGRAGLAQGVHQADPLLVPVQRRPVGQPGGRRGRGARDPGRDEQSRRAFGAGERLEQHRRGPAAERQPHQRGMGRLAERHAMQRIGPGPRGQRAHHGVGQFLHHGIKDVGPLDPLGQGGRPGQQRSLAGVTGFTGPPGDTEEGLPHVLCLPATTARVAQNGRYEEEVFLNRTPTHLPAPAGPTAPARSPRTAAGIPAAAAGHRRSIRPRWPATPAAAARRSGRSRAGPGRRSA
jgi:hypothetical protein